MNFLPFGYHKSYTINVGGPDDTKVGEFYLEPSKDLSERKTAANGTTYRELNGMATAVFKPNAVLKNANITVSVEGEGVSIIPPVIDFKPDDVKWDYAWDFTKEIPKDLKGNAFMFDGEATFNGKDTRLELPNSADKFEDGPFSVYTEWTPKDNSGDGQQIIGHFNWELFQNKDSISFNIGRMNDSTGQFYSTKYLVSKDFFNTKHTVIAIYNPGENGYIELSVDGNTAKRTYFKTDIIFRNYGRDNVSFGWAKNYNYGKNPYYSGSIHRINIASKNVLASQSTVKFKSTDRDKVSIFIVCSTLSQIKRIGLNATQK